MKLRLLGLLLGLGSASLATADTPSNPSPTKSSDTIVSQKQPDPNEVKAHLQACGFPSYQVLKLLTQRLENCILEPEQRDQWLLLLNQVQLAYNLQNSNVVIPSDKMKIARRDYRPLTSNALNPNLQVSMTADEQALSVFYPLLKTDKAQALNYLADYYQHWSQYAKNPWFSLVVNDLQDLNSLGFQSLEEIKVPTHIFIDKEQQVTHTELRNHNLVLSEQGEILVAPNGIIKLGINDFWGTTNQSDLVVTIRNKTAEPQEFLTSLQSYLQEVLRYSENYLDYWQQKEQEKKDSSPASSENSPRIKVGGSLSISGDKNSGVQISGGSIKAGSIKISGNNINISNSNISASQDIKIEAKEEVKVKKSQVTSPDTQVKAPKVDSDGSLAQATINEKKPVLTEWTLPRLVGIEKYVVELHTLAQQNQEKRQAQTLANSAGATVAEADKQTVSDQAETTQSESPKSESGSAPEANPTKENPATGISDSAEKQSKDNLAEATAEDSAVVVYPLYPFYLKAVLEENAKVLDLEYQKTLGIKLYIHSLLNPAKTKFSPAFLDAQVVREELNFHRYLELAQEFKAFKERVLAKGIPADSVIQQRIE